MKKTIRQFFSLFALSFAIMFSNVSIAAKIVATVGSKKITLQNFNKRYKEVLEQTVNPPNKAQFLEDLVRYEVGLQEAQKKKLQNDPTVKERMNQELYKALIEKALSKKIDEIRVSEKEMQSYYKRNPEIRTSHILIEFKVNATKKQIAAAKKRAKEIYSEVKKSKRPFAKLVKLYSDDSSSKANEGDVGWQNRFTLVPSYYNAALKMKKGEIKGLIRTQYGFHIVKLTGKRKYKEANKSSIRAAVFDSKRKVIFDQYFKTVKKSYKINVNKSAIK